VTKVLRPIFVTQSGEELPQKEDDDSPNQSTEDNGEE
jgi:hypothetical protein